MVFLQVQLNKEQAIRAIQVRLINLNMAILAEGSDEAVKIQRRNQKTSLR
jgi:hypothetical protein